ncbi:MAG: hypothetical protein ACD_44C00350G0004 [uncultured bacterium]|nr:MAG: hypothetical protein ACD_44C00350G0004 [uncultured bacterium]OGT15369.1 MAG: hypothetical protein A3B69_05055 [Gammaproteobacteria bacterium RIFCSPHIGHO2_02_FULL_38_33]OGT24035.1 MAG: hypothetical protein A2W47_05285 [Gammaproteobacteria bacterium RIFCSPHIGHO2_12_38_15]OGT69256.1 MAG: hypothetical protein A3I12_04445 [Gammaproteobacteria bacterium RIFCSPLOWO2_02_FULL_38_11]OGT75225.1 MAG: hypothetical protein A3G71_01500 [Gammaproteobacteria bacterium RIFCSPLOWO2_12_FULL_38_14]
MIHDKEYIIRIEGSHEKNDVCFLTLQIKNTRAVFDIALRDLCLYKHLLCNIAPFQLIEIGHLHKNEELKIKKGGNINLFEKLFNFIEKISLRKFKTSISSNTKPYSLRIADYKVKNKDLMIMLLINGTHRTFELSLFDLKKDLNLIGNIQPEDLIRIGYIAKEEELKTDLKLATTTRGER